MSRDDARKNATPSSTAPTSEHPSVGRSGAGADTALLAMLKKRQQRATRENEPDPPDDTPKPAGQ